MGGGGQFVRGVLRRGPDRPDVRCERGAVGDPRVPRERVDARGDARPEQVETEVSSPRLARTREGDQNKRAWMKHWWSDGGRDLVVGITAITACIGVFVLAAFIYRAAEQRAEDQRIVRVIAEETAKNSKATAAAARAACLRSLELGPSLYEDYRIRKVLTGAKLQLYLSLIPK